MSDSTPILDITSPDQATNSPPALLFDLRVMPGDCVLIEARDRALANEFANLCCGLSDGFDARVRFLGRDWTGASHEYHAAMRGRIGRTYGSGGWIQSYGTDVNIFAAQLHHTRRSEDELRDS